MKRITFALFVLIPVLTGCVTGTRSLDNLQIPELRSVERSVGEVYIARIDDARVFEENPRSPSTPSVRGDLSSTSQETLATLIGRQRNGYGAAMGDVALPQGGTVQSVVRELLVEGLESRGYTVVEDQSSPMRVYVDVDKFWAWFSPGFAMVSFESNVQTSIEFEQPAGTRNFIIEGYGINRAQVASNANWELAFQRAFEDFLNNLDQQLSENGL
jgi:hypothetical protein